MVFKFSHIGQQNYMEGTSNDFKFSKWFNNPNILFTPTNKNGKVTLTTKLKNNFEGKLYSTLQSNKPNPNGLTGFFGWETDWSPDGKFLAVGYPLYETSTTVEIDSGCVYLYKFEEISKPNPQPFNVLNLKTDELEAFFGSCVRWSPDGTKLAVGVSGTNSQKGALFIYNLVDILNNQNPNPNPNPDPFAKIFPTNVSANARAGFSVNWNFDGSQIAIGAFQDQKEIGSVYIYNTIDLTNPVNFIIPPGRKTFFDTGFGFKVEWNSSNTYLAISAINYDKRLTGLNNREDDSGAIYIYSVEKLKTTSNPAPEHVLESQSDSVIKGYNLKWSSDGKYLAFNAFKQLSNSKNISSDNQIYIYKTDDFKLPSPTPVILSGFNDTNSIFFLGIDWNKAGTKLAIGSSQYIYIFDANKIVTGIEPTQKIKLPETQQQSVYSHLRWHPSDKYLAVSLIDKPQVKSVVYILN